VHQRRRADCRQPDPQTARGDFPRRKRRRRPSAFQFLNLNSDLDSPDYKLVIEKGVLAIKHQLEEKTRALGSAVSRSGMDEVNGCRAAIYACDALLALAQNLANSAEQLAAAETNAYRRAELLDSAAILHHVPAHPARSFKEACQAFYLFQLALQLDNGSYAVNPEGADKALLPYYQRDINNGALTRSRRMKSSSACGSSWRS
jgi:formate C-acetyltransferase